MQLFYKENYSHKHKTKKKKVMLRIETTKQSYEIEEVQKILYHPSTVMVKASHTTVTNAAVLRPSRSASKI